MKEFIFIAGTDTGVGKTAVSCSILKNLHKINKKALGLKPVATGACITRNGLRNRDALLLQQASSVKISYEVINPICLEYAIAPHIAANIFKVSLSTQVLYEIFKAQYTQYAEINVVEGVGGWEVPLNKNETMADFVALMKWPIILVVPIKLGCLNHTLLTIRNIKDRKLLLLGWVANFIDHNNMECAQENINFLCNKIDAPCLDVIPRIV